MEFRLKAHQWLKQKKFFKDHPKATLWLDRFFWTLEVWPLHILLLIFLFHISVLACISDTRESAFNRGLGSFLQIIGASVILWCLTQNLGLLKGKKIRDAIREAYNGWKTRWPMGRQMGRSMTVTQGLQLVVKEAPPQDQPQFNTIEEKVDYLLKRSVELEKSFNRIRNALAQRINDVDTELRKVKKSFQCEVDSLKSTMNHALLDGVMWEITGFLTATYGVFISGFLG